MRSVGVKACRPMAWVPTIPGTSAPWCIPRELPLEIMVAGTHQRHRRLPADAPQSFPNRIAPTGYRYSSILPLFFGCLPIARAERRSRTVVPCGEFSEVGAQGSGLRAQGLMSKVQGSGFRVPGFRVPGFRAQGSELRAQGSGLRVQRNWCIFAEELAIDIQYVPFGTYRWPSSRYESAGLDSLTFTNSPSFTDASADGHQLRCILLIDSRRVAVG